MSKVNVRIALAIDKSGNWTASGWSNKDGTPADGDAMDLCIDCVDEGEARYWIECELDILEPQVIVPISVERQK